MYENLVYLTRCGPLTPQSRDLSSETCEWYRYFAVFHELMVRTVNYNHLPLCFCRPGRGRLTSSMNLLASKCPVKTRLMTDTHMRSLPIFLGIEIKRNAACFGVELVQHFVYLYANFWKYGGINRITSSNVDKADDLLVQSHYNRDPEDLTDMV